MSTKPERDDVKSQAPPQEGRRKYLKTVGALAAGLAIGGAAAWLGKPAERIKVPGPTVTETVTKTVAAPTTPTPTPTPTPTSKRWKGVTINVACDERIENKRMFDLVPEFEEATGIKVNFEVMPEVTLLEKVTVDLATGTGLYDVIQYDFMRTVQFGPMGRLTPLNELIAKPELCNPAWFKLENFSKKYLDSLSYKGQIYGLPLFCHTQTLIINTSIFAKYGLTKAPETMEELLDTAKAVHHPKEDIYAFACRSVPGQVANIWPWTIFLETYGGRWFDEKWMPAFNSPEGVKATELYCTLLRDYGPPGYPTLHWAELQTLLCDGKLAMVIDCETLGYRAQDPSISKVVGNIALAYVPYAEATKKRVTGLWTWGIMIPALSKQKEAAWQFVQWWTSTDVGKRCQYLSTAEAVSYCANSLVKNPTWLPPAGEVVGRSLEMADPEFRPRIPEWNDIGDRVGIAVNEVLTGIKSAKKALDEAAKDVYEIMKKAGYYG